MRNNNNTPQQWPACKDFNLLISQGSNKFFTKYFIIKFNGNKRKLNPFSIEQEITAQLKGKSEDISAADRDGLLVTVRNESQSQNIATLKSIGGVLCEVEQHRSMNITKGIIYIYEFDLEDINNLKEGLTIFGVTNVEEAIWIKP